MFVIPVNPQDLYLDRPGRLRVEEIAVSKSKPAALVSRLEDALERCQTAPLAICESAVFDLLFAVTRAYSGMNEDVRTALFKCLKCAVDTTRKSAEKFLGSKAAASIDVYKQELSAYVQPLNMLGYLTSLAIIEAEKAEVDTAKGKGKVKKEKGAVLEGWQAGSSLKDKMLVSILALLDLDLSRFWSLSYPESEFCLLWTKAGAAMMENAANLKVAALKSNVFTLFARLVNKYDQHINVAHIITEQLHNVKHVPKYYAAMLEDMVNKHDNAQFVGEVVRQVGHIDLAALSKDLNASKNIAEFMSYVATALPKVVLQNISMFMSHLDAEHYAIRNGMIETIGQLVLHAFDNTPGAKDEGQQTRNKLLECLQERFLDSNAFCRAKTMEVWSTLLETRGVVPLDFVTEITNLTVRRLHDKAVAVRKKALQLLATLIQFNPFCPSLNVSALKARLDKEAPRFEAASAAIAAALTAKNKENSPAPAEEERAVLEENGDAAAAAPAAAAAAAAAAAVVVEPPPSRELPAEHVAAVKEWGLLQKTIAFAETLDKATHIMCKMLSSKNATDLKEVIKFFTTAKEFYLESADHGFRKMLVLLWNEEKGVKTDVVNAYKETYLSVIDIPKNTPDAAKYAYFQMAQKLIGLTAGATLSQLTSLEQLMAEFLKADLIPQGVIDTLWTIFCGTTSHIVNGVAVPDSCGAVILLSMVASVHPETVRDNIEKLARVGLLDTARWVADPFFAKHVCIALQKMNSTDGARFEPGHAIFDKLTNLLLTWDGLASNWCQSAEQVVNSIYILCSSPHEVVEPVVRNMTTKVLADIDNVSVDELARLLFLVGHVALKELLLVEAVKIEQQAKRQAKTKDESPESRSTNKKSKDNMEDELGMDEQNAALEDEYLTMVADKQIVCNNMLGLFGPILQMVLLDKEKRYASHTLQAVASLSLAKFMSVSLTFCKVNLQLLFTVLERSEDETIRSNIMIALGDLSFRFPNLIEAWNPSIYARLQDKSPHVRKTTIMVLSHLILNGVIKIKNNGGLLALAVIDENSRISEFSRQFFLKLSLTDKGIYNALPDIVSYLSQHKPRLDDASFRKIVQFVFSFIQTDAESVSLIEKLCHRFTNTNNVQQWRDIACCLSMLSFNEKGIKKLYACAGTFKEICHDDVIYLHFVEMIKKSKGQSAQASVEVQKIIDECYMKHHPNSSLPTGEAAVKKGGKRGAAAAGKGKRGRRTYNDNDDGDDDDDGDDENDDDGSSLQEEDDEPVGVRSAPEAPTGPVATASKPTTKKAKATAAKKRAPAKIAKPLVAAARPKRTGRAIVSTAAAPVYSDEDSMSESMSFSDEE